MSVRLRKYLTACCYGAFCLTAFAAGPAYSLSMTEVLAAAYQNNPTLRAERASVRAVDETVSQAVAGWRPTIITSGDYAYKNTSTSPGAKGVGTEPHNVDITVTQPIFRGFRTVNSTREADASVLAARQNLINVEQSVLLEAATAFMNVVRDQAIVTLRNKNVSVLREQLRASQARFRVGEITRTDVAQSRARLSGAISSQAQARATLAASRADFARVVGRPAGSLRRVRSVARMVPKRLNAVIKAARRRNPILLGAIQTEKASHHAVKAAKGELLPTISVDARYERSYEPTRFINNVETTTITGRVSVPLYQSGAEYSRIRQAKQVNSQRRRQITEAERTVHAEAVSAWENLRATRQVIVSSRAQVDANRLALRGVRQEARVGSRTVLDVLDAEQELLDSQVASVQARRNQIVAGYRLLAAVGRLTARALALPVRYYDPVRHYKRVRGKWIGFGSRESD